MFSLVSINVIEYVLDSEHQEHNPLYRIICVLWHFVQGSNIKKNVYAYLY